MLSNITKMIMTLLTIVALTGCATITSGVHQPVTISTGSIKGASCSLQNDKGHWLLKSTPGVAIINRSYKDLAIDCNKNGYPVGHKSVLSHTKPAGVATANAIIGGVIGTTIDIASGAAYDYPEKVDVPLKKAV